MNISLEKWQTEILQPFFDEAREALESGEPIGILAQVFETPDSEFGGYMDVRLVDTDKCRAIQKITGLEEGKVTPDRDITVLTPCYISNK